MSNNHASALVHYVIHSAPRHLGATKLNKVLWFADVVAYRRLGRSLTGAQTYRRMPFGPVPTGIDFIITDLKDEGAIVEEQAPTIVGNRREFVSKTPPNVDCFSRQEIALVHEVLAFVQRMTAEEASDLSHSSLWHELENGDGMSVAAGSVFPDEVTDADFDALDAAPSHS